MSRDTRKAIAKMRMQMGISAAMTISVKLARGRQIITTGIRKLPPREVVREAERACGHRHVISHL